MVGCIARLAVWRETCARLALRGWVGRIGSCSVGVLLLLLLGWGC
jgi:hypothetical protein